jgi:glycosyltransferase involved in cell wall biosynthesis
MKVLLSAYACEPGKGSEPGVGWKWTCGLPDRVALTVLTRSNNREAITRTVEGTPSDHPLRGVRFLYHDLGPVWRYLKRRGLLPTMAYYFLWQWTAARRFHSEASASDVIHHLTFCTSLCPGFWQAHHHKLVIGPTAAPLVNPHYLPLFGAKAPLQALRNLLIRRCLRLSWWRDTFRKAAVVVPANSETRSLFQSAGVPTREIMLDTGAPEPCAGTDRAATPEAVSGEPACVFLYAGVIERRKGLEMIVRAFASAAPRMKPVSAKLVILGQGPDLARLKHLARNLGLSDRIEFPGAVPHGQVALHFRKSDVFVFASVRDASGGVNLEAMSHGLPLVCIAHQGIADITTDDCAERIPAGDIGQTIEGLSDAFVRLARNPETRQRMGESAKHRAMGAFAWPDKFSRMISCYGETVRKASSQTSR